MREILFRGKRIDGKYIDGSVWTEGYYVGEQTFVEKTRHWLLDINATKPHSHYYYSVDPSTVGQYTGKTDTNKAKIFEHDIIRANHDGAVGVIRFGEAVGVYPGNACHVGFYVDWQGEDKDYLRADLGYWASRSDVEVIGNIHDNPELLAQPADPDAQEL